VVGRHLGDDVGGVVVADGAVVDLHGVVLCKERKGGILACLEFSGCLIM